MINLLKQSVKSHYWIKASYSVYRSEILGVRNKMFKLKIINFHTPILSSPISAFRGRISNKPLLNETYTRYKINSSLKFHISIIRGFRWIYLNMSVGIYPVIVCININREIFEYTHIPTKYSSISIRNVEGSEVCEYVIPGHKAQRRLRYPVKFVLTLLHVTGSTSRRYDGLFIEIAVKLYIIFYNTCRIIEKQFDTRLIFETENSRDEFVQIW